MYAKRTRDKIDDKYSDISSEKLHPFNGLFSRTTYG